MVVVYCFLYSCFFCGLCVFCFFFAFFLFLLLSFCFLLFLRCICMFVLVVCCGRGRITTSLIRPLALGWGRQMSADYTRSAFRVFNTCFLISFATLDPHTCQYLLPERIPKAKGALQVAFRQRQFERMQFWLGISINHSTHPILMCIHRAVSTEFAYNRRPTVWWRNAVRLPRYAEHGFLQVEPSDRYKVIRVCLMFARVHDAVVLFLLHSIHLLYVALKSNGSSMMPCVRRLAARTLDTWTPCSSMFEYVLVCLDSMWLCLRLDRTIPSKVLQQNSCYVRWNRIVSYSFTTYQIVSYSSI